LLYVPFISFLSVFFFISVPPTILAKRINPSHLLDLNFDKQSDDLERSTAVILKKRIFLKSDPKLDLKIGCFVVGLTACINILAVTVSESGLGGPCGN